MEAIVLLGIVILGFLAGKTRRRARFERRLRPKIGKSAPVSRSPRTTTDTASVRKARSRPGQDPFDADTAVHLQERQVLTGRAFVIDGDSLVIAKTQIRLFGVDAPEMNHPFGKKAKWALHALCKGQTIKAEITDVDAYGRTVAQCFLSDGRDLSAEMVKRGLALDWPKFSGGQYAALEVPDARRKLWLADARQKGRMHVWEKYEARRGSPD